MGAYFQIVRGLQCDETQKLAFKTLVKLIYAKKTSSRARPCPVI